MSNVKFYLKQKEKKNSIIFLKYFPSPNIQIKYYIGEAVPVIDWLPKSQRLSKRNPLALSVNNLMDALEIKCKQIRMDLLSEGKLTRENFKHELDVYFGKEKPRTNIDFFSFLDQLIIQRKNSPNFSANTIKSYITFYNATREFREIFTFEDIDTEFLHDYINFLFRVKKYRRNTAGKRIATLKMVMNEALSLGVSKNSFHTHKDFSIPYKLVLSPFLTDQEIEVIQNLENLSEPLNNARIHFLKACYTGLRLGDVMRLNINHLTTIQGEEFIAITQEKTDYITHIPLSFYPQLKGILEKKVYKISGQKLNKHIQELCRIAGITGKFTRTEYFINKVEAEYNKADLITIHSARRSFVCNLYLRGVRSELIRRISGHKSEEAYNHYLQLSSLDGLRNLNL